MEPLRYYHRNFKIQVGNGMSVVKCDDITQRVIPTEYGSLDNYRVRETYLRLEESFGISLTAY